MMDDTTKWLWKFLWDHNETEMAIMFKRSDGMEEFAKEIEDYVHSVLLEEVDWSAIATEFAEIPF